MLSYPSQIPKLLPVSTIEFPSIQNSEKQSQLGPHKQRSWVWDWMFCFVFLYLHHWLGPRTINYLFRLKAKELYHICVYSKFGTVDEIYKGNGTMFMELISDKICRKIHSLFPGNGWSSKIINKLWTSKYLAIWLEWSSLIYISSSEPYWREYERNSFRFCKINKK